MPAHSDEIKPIYIEAFTLYQQGLSQQKIGELLGITQQAAQYRIAQAKSLLAKEIPDSPIINQRKRLTAILPDTGKVYEKIVKQVANEDNYSDKDAELALRASESLNKGLQVLVPKSEEATKIHSIEEKRLTAILDNKLTDQLGLDREIVDVDAIVEDEPTTPPAGGTTTTDE